MAIASPFSRARAAPIPVACARPRLQQTIIEEWNVSKGGANPEALCGIKGHRRRCGSAVNIEEMPVAASTGMSSSMSSGSEVACEP